MAFRTFWAHRPSRRPPSKLIRRQSSRRPLAPFRLLTDCNKVFTITLTGCSRRSKRRNNRHNRHTSPPSKCPLKDKCPLPSTRTRTTTSTADKRTHIKPKWRKIRPPTYPVSSQSIATGRTRCTRCYFAHSKRSRLRKRFPALTAASLPNIPIRATNLETPTLARNMNRRMRPETR